MVLLPRFAQTPFQLLETPKRLQEMLERDYRTMLFEPVRQVVEDDNSYQAAVIDGISSTRSRTPELRYSPISGALMKLAYDQLTPLIDQWAGQPLEQSWGYGIRSYGPGSYLHMHRDRVETHVVSCIVHVEDQSNHDWPLDFIDHEAMHHRVLFKPGTMLFYESLCPHGRASEFDGNFYRNMYFHWRPKNWDPTPYQRLDSKFASIEEACLSNKNLNSFTSIPDNWRNWLITNHEIGCDREGMIKLAMAQGYERSALEQVLDKGSSVSVSMASGVTEQKTSPPSMLEWFEAPLTRPSNQPRAWKLDTPLVQLYEIPGLLTPTECKQVIEAINSSLQPSKVTRGSNNYRTSRTCHLRQNHRDLALKLDRRFAELVGVDPKLSEPTQGQRYDPGEYFKEHTDWFAPGTQEFLDHTRVGGQRTWTVMIYLNHVEAGGETLFKNLGRTFTPLPGLGLAWNNLQADGTPNPFTLHEAIPVSAGNKWVLTKWFRTDFGRNN